MMLGVGGGVLGCAGVGTFLRLVGGVEVLLGCKHLGVVNAV